MNMLHSFRSYYTNQCLVANDMHNQEASLKIRLLKRQGALKRKKIDLNNSVNNDSKSFVSSAKDEVVSRIR